MLTRHPRVTVAICLFNSSRFIDETLASVFAQSFDDYEIVLVDDGSTDGCADRIADRYRQRSLRIIRQPHSGLSIARRTTIANARGDYIAFLDHDDIWLPDKLARQFEDAQANPEAALLFSDCQYINPKGQAIGRLSDEYRLADLDLSGSNAYAELLNRGCFVWQSTAFARTDALKAVDYFNPRFPYIADYDTWLQMARLFPLHYTPAVLAKWRVYEAQFTHRCPDVTLADHRKLLGSLYRTASIPRSIRVRLGDRLLGQHRCSAKQLAKQRRYLAAARALGGMCSYPDRLAAFCIGAIAETPHLGNALRPVYRWMRSKRQGMRRPGAVGPSRTHVWFDGSVLSEMQTGYFSLASGLIRDCTRDSSRVVHVVTSESGRRALSDHLGSAAQSIHFHQDVAGRGPAPHEDTVEVLIWRGRFRWSDSRRIAIVPDLTTRLFPELHTPANVAEFDEFLGYVQRHATEIHTVSENSRRDIVKMLRVFPDSVKTIAMPIHPDFIEPQFDPAIPLSHGISGPYLLHVGCIEPRKNLRRLVRAFELLKHEPAMKHMTLVIAGPQGWDDTFPRFVLESDVYHSIRVIGFVPQGHLPSLFHYATVVVYPSLYEGYGLPVCEAMSSSGVVVASATSSLPEVLGSGIMFDPYQTESIAGAILRAVSMTAKESSNYRRSMRQRAIDLMSRGSTSLLVSEGN